MLKFKPWHSCIEQMSNQARWAVLQSYNLLKWHRAAHRAAVKALESGDSLSVVIRSIEETMYFKKWASEAFMKETFSFFKLLTGYHFFWFLGKGIMSVHPLSIFSFLNLSSNLLCSFSLVQGSRYVSEVKLLLLICMYYSIIMQMGHIRYALSTMIDSNQRNNFCFNKWPFCSQRLVPTCTGHGSISHSMTTHWLSRDKVIVRMVGYLQSNSERYTRFCFTCIITRGRWWITRLRKRFVNKCCIQNISRNEPFLDNSFLHFLFFFLVP